MIDDLKENVFTIDEKQTVSREIKTNKKINGSSRTEKYST